MENIRSYPAKLLLFGEHVLLRGAPALAIPLHTYGGQWAWRPTPDRHHERLQQFARSKELEQVSGLDTAAFIRDLSKGLFFQSDIPTGYGLGSSGALCAGVYDRYVSDKTADLAALKAIFARMESFFHGNSSGIDPLTSYVAAPVLLESAQQLQTVPFPVWNTPAPVVFLLDTRLPRRTGPLVEWFLAQCATPEFGGMLDNSYLPAHVAMLQGWLSADAEKFWSNLHRISSLQFEFFIPMVPATLRQLWEKSLSESAFKLKICGAGGGGFMLGFARNQQTAEELKANFSMILVNEGNSDIDT